MRANRRTAALVASIAVSSGMKPQTFSDDVREVIRESKARGGSVKFSGEQYQTQGAQWKARLFRAGAHNVTAAARSGHSAASVRIFQAR
jgi:hypothetical protein